MEMHCQFESVKRLWDEDTRSGLELHVLLLGPAPLLVQQGLTESLAAQLKPTARSKTASRSRGLTETGPSSELSVPGQLPGLPRKRQSSLRRQLDLGHSRLHDNDQETSPRRRVR
jgi:hypothetical protein